MLYEDLLQQARHLARRERKRPRDASLRRAVSSAYYGLFHYLVAEACAFLISGQPRKELRQRLARSFEHGRMKEAAHQVAKEKLGSDKLRNVAKTFVELQQERHDADYSLTRRFRRSEVEARLTQAEGAIADWKAVRGQAEAEIFLVSMLVKLR